MPETNPTLPNPELASTPRPSASPPMLPAHRGKRILVLFGLLVILSLFSGAYYLGQQSQQKLVPPLPPEVSPLPPVVVQDETGELKTYTNAEFNFSIKYPSSWILESNEGQPIRIKNNENLTQEDQAKLGVTYSSSEISKAEFVIELDPTLSADMAHLRQITQSTDTLRITQQTEMTFQSYPAIKYQANGIGLDDRGFSGINVAAQNGILRISLHNYIGDSQNQQILDQILSTFQFIETPQTTEDSANWRTITRNLWSFSVPENWKYTECSDEKAIFLDPAIVSDSTRECNFDARSLMSINRVSNTYPIPSDTTKPQNTEIYVIVSNKQTIQIDGKEGIIQHEDHVGGQGEGKYISAYIKDKEYLYFFIINDTSREGLFKNILASFKFK